MVSGFVNRDLQSLCGFSLSEFGLSVVYRMDGWILVLSRMMCISNLIILGIKWNGLLFKFKFKCFIYPTEVHGIIYNLVLVSLISFLVRQFGEHPDSHHRHVAAAPSLQMGRGRYTLLLHVCPRPDPVHSGTKHHKGVCN